MTTDQLRQQWTEAYKIIQRERDMRGKHLSGKKRDRGIAEMDRLLGIVTGWKDEIKRHAEPSPEQQPLPGLPNAQYP